MVGNIAVRDLPTRLVFCLLLPNLQIANDEPSSNLTHQIAHSCDFMVRAGECFLCNRFQVSVLFLLSETAAAYPEPAEPNPGH